MNEYVMLSYRSVMSCSSVATRLANMSARRSPGADTNSETDRLERQLDIMMNISICQQCLFFLAVKWRHRIYTVTIRSPFCGYNLAWCVELKAKLYEVIHIKLNQFTKMPIRSLAYCIKRTKALLQWPTFFSVLPTRWRRKPAGIDTEPNYITVTLCISLATKLTLSKLQRQSILTSC